MHIQWQRSTCIIIESTTTYTPHFITVAHTELLIFPFLLITQRGQVGLCKWGIKNLHTPCGWYLCSPLPTYTSFVQNRYAEVALNMYIWWWQTTWVVLAPTTTHIKVLSLYWPEAHTEFWIFALYFISQSEQICKWGIKYANSVTKDHLGSTCAHNKPHTKISSLLPIKNSGYFFSFFFFPQQICKGSILLLPLHI